MSDQSAIRIMIADDYDLVRQGICAMLREVDDFEMVGEAGDGITALSLCAEHQPDVVLMDLVMPKMDGIAATRAICQQYPGTQVVILSSFSDRDKVIQVFRAGAISYVLKSISDSELVDAIRLAAVGRPMLSPDVAEALIAVVKQMPAVGQNLSQREREVLALMAQGLSNQQVATQLGVSLNTIKTHVTNILSKLGTTNRLEAVTLALEHHLV